MAGKWGNLPNFLFVVEFQVYTNIPSVSTLVWLLFDDNGFVMCNYSFFYYTCYRNRAPEKWRFRSLQSLLLPQFSTYRYRTGFIVKRKQGCSIGEELGVPLLWNTQLIFNTYKLKKKSNFEICLFCPKNTRISRNSVKFIIHFFLQKSKFSIRMYVVNAMITINFWLSLKSYEE